MKEKNNIKMVKYPNNDLYQSRKICAFQKVLKTTTSTQPYPPPPLTPTPSSSKVESIFAPKRSSGYGCYRGPTCTYSRQGLLLAGKTIEVVTMPLSLKTRSSAGYRDQ